MQEYFVWYSPLNVNDYYQLYEKKRCYVGVMHNVAHWLNEHKIPAQVVLPELSPKDFEGEMYRAPRVLQPRLIQAGKEQRYGLLAAAPGCGKTNVLSAIIAELGRKAVVLTEALEPFEGAYETLINHTNCDVGRIGGGFHETGHDVTVCMVQTWNRRLKKEEIDQELIQCLRGAKVWVTDEAHNCLCNSYFSMYEYAENAEFFLGTTATPFTNNDRETLLYARIGPIIGEIKYGEAITNKILVPFTCYIENTEEVVFCKDKKKLSGYHRKLLWAKVHKEFIVNNAKRNQQYVDFARECNSNERTCAIIVAQTKHGNNIKKLMPEAVEVYGPTPKKKRKEIWQRLQNREISCVITTLMDEATDIPSLDAVAIAAGGKSKVKMIQRLRNLRSFSGETAAGYYEKDRGFIYITDDKADFVQAHSKMNIGYLKELKREHRENEIVRI